MTNGEPRPKRPESRSPASKPAGHGIPSMRWPLAIGLSVIATGMVVGSWRLDGDGFWAGALLEFGAALALFVPLLLLERHLEQRIKAFETRTSQIAADVAQVEARSALPVSDLNVAVGRASDEHRAVYTELIAELRQQVSQKALAELATLAAADNAVAPGGIRSALVAGLLDARLTVLGPNLHMRIEHWYGDPIIEVEWPATESAADFFPRLQAELRREGTFRHPVDFESYVESLLDDYEWALDARAGTLQVPADLGRLLQRTGSQFVITADGIECTDYYYFIAWGRMQEVWYPHMREKPWVDIEDFDAALTVAESLERRGNVFPPDHTPDGFLESSGDG